MSGFSLSGGVEVTGFISPSSINDTYPVIDPLYGIDGFRNVNTLIELNNIPTPRRRAGMIVGVSGGTEYYRLKQQPWNSTISDWEFFQLGLFTGGTGSCITELYVENVFACDTGVTIHNDFTPVIDNTINLGTQLKRYRDINTVSGTSTVWSATTRIYTPEVNLGLDSFGNTRTITSNNSIIQDDILNGGIF